MEATARRSLGRVRTGPWPRACGVITPKVSIVLPTYQAASTINDALTSVFRQTFESFECIVVDDGSTDDTVAHLSGWSDPRFCVIRQPHRGVVTALRRGADEAKGQYIARLDADDTWEDPRKLARQLEYLDEHPECVVIGTAFRVVRPAGSTTLVQPPTE